MFDDWGRLEGVSQGCAACTYFHDSYLLRSAHLVDQGGVAVCVYCLKIAFSLVKKEYVKIFWKVKK